MKKILLFILLISLCFVKISYSARIDVSGGGGTGGGTSFTNGSDVTIGNLTVNGTGNFSGNVTAPFFLGNGSQLTGLPTYINYTEPRFNASFLNKTIGNISDQILNITSDVTFGNLTTTGNITAGTLGAGAITGTSLIKSGGTSSQFLKADGSVDTSTYSNITQILALQNLTNYYNVTQVLAVQNFTNYFNVTNLLALSNLTNYVNKTAMNSTIDVNLNVTYGVVAYNNFVNKTTQTRGFTIYNMTALHDIPTTVFYNAANVTRIEFMCVGGTNATVTIERAARPADGNVANITWGCLILNSTLVTGNTWVNYTVFNNSAILANDIVRQNTTTVNGVPATFTTTIKYSE
jgi:hypothetical protein